MGPFHLSTFLVFFPVPTPFNYSTQLNEKIHTPITERNNQCKLRSSVPQGGPVQVNGSICPSMLSRIKHSQKSSYGHILAGTSMLRATYHGAVFYCLHTFKVY